MLYNELRGYLRQIKLPVATQAPGWLRHSGAIRKESNTVWLT